MTIPEPVQKVVHSTVDGLKQNPSCLGAVVLAGLFAFLTYLALQREAERSQARLETTVRLLTQCMEERAQ
jgi:hypothetical protein